MSLPETLLTVLPYFKNATEETLVKSLPFGSLLLQL